MSFLWPVFTILGLILLSSLLLIALVLFSPLVFIIDSEKGHVRVRWLAAVEYRRPLPGSEGETKLSIAGKSVNLPARIAKRKRKRAAAPRKPRRNRAAFIRFLRRCLREPAIRRVLAKRFGQLGKAMLRSIALTHRELNVSLPDPAWNGMLAGWQAWRNGGRGSAVRVNFTGENGIFLEVRLYPYRVAKALLVFSTGLPYRALWREWRAASAAVSG